MKANELRIGNYFIRNGEIDTVYELDSEPHDDHPRINYLGCNSAKPIPLTEEWLIKFGWGKGKYDTEYYDNVSLKQGVLFYNIDAKILCVETNSDVIEISTIKYVHQLQNLYFVLTGTEL